MDALGSAELTLTEDADHPGAAISEAIRIARVVCIFFMVFVHVHPGTAEFVPGDGLRVFDVLRFFMVDSMGRASVALLSVIAGYLAVYSLRRERAGVFLRKKTRSLVVPLLLWNLAMLGMVLVGDQLHEGYIEKSLDTSISLRHLPELLLGIGGKPANEPLAFLHDIFVCALFTPVLLLALRRSNALFALATLAIAVAAVATPVDVRPSIPVLYAVGLYLAIRGIVPIPTPGLTLAAAMAFVLLGAIVAWRDLTSLDGEHAGLTWLEAGFNLIRAPAALAFWSLALALRDSRLGVRIARLEPYIFTAFCIHLMVSRLGWAAWEPAFGGYFGTLYPLFFFGIPVLVVAAAIVGAKVLNAATPWLFSLLNGGRNLPGSRRKRLTPAQHPGLEAKPA